MEWTRSGHERRGDRRKEVKARKLDKIEKKKQKGTCRKEHRR